MITRTTSQQYKKILLGFYAIKKFFTSLTILNMLAGYIIGITFIPRFIRQEKALKFSALAGIIFTLAAIFSQGITAVIFISFLGLANSLVWPSIWPLAIKGLGRFTKTGSSLLIMAIGGGAVLPLLYGRLAETYSPHIAYCGGIAKLSFYFILLHKGT